MAASLRTVRRVRVIWTIWCFKRPSVVSYRAWCFYPANSFILS